MADNATKAELQAQLEEMKARAEKAETEAKAEAEARKEAEAEAGELRAQLESAENEKKLSENTQPGSANELVEVFIPKGAAGDDPNHFIGVNGQNYLLPKGKTSKVPAFIADEYNRSVAAQEKLDEHVAEMRSEE